MLLHFSGAGVLLGLDNQGLDSNSPSNLVLYTTLIYIEIFIEILFLLLEQSIMTNKIITANQTT